MARVSAAAERRYALVARAWAIVFAAVLVVFALAPAPVGTFLTRMAGALGLGGSIATEPTSLWYVLGLSLMVAVTGLAWDSADRPGARAPYLVLLAAKITSTAGFVGLALQAGELAWLLCSAGDGFVALTLWAARRGLILPPAYEVWFGKLNAAPDRAFWFRYTWLDGQIQEAGTWAIAFDRAAGIQAGRNRFGIAELGAAPLFQLADNRLLPGRAAGKAGDLAWDLTFRETSGPRAHDHVPRLLAVLGIAKTRYEAPWGDLRFSGTVRASGREWAVTDAPGMIGHIRGSRSGHSWAWAHCNTFEGQPDAAFEGLSARVMLGARPSPPLSSFVLWEGGRCHRFTSTLGAFRAASRFGAGRWVFRAESGGLVLEGLAEAPAADQVALVTYTDTDGSQQWCRNSKLGDLTVRLIAPDGTVREFRARGTAAFELVDRMEPDRPVDL